MKNFVLGAVVAIACVLPASVSAQVSGDPVMAFNNGGSWTYPAVVTSVSGRRVTLRWETGSTSVVDKAYVGLFHWAAGSVISCRWPGDGEFYWARITRMNSDAKTMNIVWTDDNTTASIAMGKCRSPGKEFYNFDGYPVQPR